MNSVVGKKKPKVEPVEPIESNDKASIKT
jgi:hypothetical protein